MSPAIPAHIEISIQERLSLIEHNENVRILYACESGSRAWGFASADSDYDVRFIYIRPLEWYLSIDMERRRDVIELPIEGDLDINGWDVRKALNLFRKSNPPLLEWLSSGIIYRNEKSFTDAVDALKPRVYSPISCRHHYLNMAENNFRGELQREVVRLKKYLYVLRPLLAVRWIDLEKGAPPIEFEILMQETLEKAGTDYEVMQELVSLLQKKASGKEKDLSPQNPVLHAFIQNELRRRKEMNTPGVAHTPEIEPLNALFQNTLRTVWAVV